MHDLIGANRLMLSIFNDNKTQLGVLSNNFPETITKTEAMQQSAATVTPVSQSLINDTLDFTLCVNSNTGHKLPSAYPSRRVILHVKVKDASGNVVFESGKVNANGSVTGVDADTDLAAFEPHHELIHQPLAYGFAQDLFNESGAEIQDFQKMFQASNAKSTTITTHIQRFTLGNIRTQERVSLSRLPEHIKDNVLRFFQNSRDFCLESKNIRGAYHD